MDNLFFPQLTSGALVQYPIHKTRLVRTVKNILPDGRMILFSDSGGARLVWKLSYTDLAMTDIQALQDHFAACLGPFHAFTFIDPTDNMLSSSSDLTNLTWQMSSVVRVEGGIADPSGGTAAFRLTNTSEAKQEISQSLAVPAGYQYCFSFYAMSIQSTSVDVFRRAPSAQQSTSMSAGPVWTRLVSSGQLSDSGTTLSVGISLTPGQQIEVYGLQLEPQLAPSRYRPTGNGGVYPNAHWVEDQLMVAALAPNLFSTSFTIETAL